MWLLPHVISYGKDKYFFEPPKRNKQTNKQKLKPTGSNGDERGPQEPSPLSHPFIRPPQDFWPLPVSFDIIFKTLLCLPADNSRGIPPEGSSSKARTQVPRGHPTYCPFCLAAPPFLPVFVFFTTDQAFSDGHKFLSHPLGKQRRSCEDEWPHPSCLVRREALRIGPHGCAFYSLGKMEDCVPCIRGGLHYH